MDKINIAKLLNSDLGADLKFELDESIHNLDLPTEMIGKRVAGKLTVIKLDGLVLLKGDLLANAVLICDRCLDNFKAHIPFNLECEYNLNRSRLGEGGLAVDKFGGIDLTIPLREEIILALPIKNICGPNCAGICAGCGVNLNKEKCTCKKERE